MPTAPGEFVVYAYPRTGSYHLTSLLDSCPDITCHGELFKRGLVELSKQVKAAELQDADKRDADPIGFLQRVKALTPDQHFGFKIFQAHIRAVPALDTVLKRWKRVLLFRDPIETYASLLRARKTNLWTLSEDKDVNESRLREPVRFAPESLARFSKSYNPFLRRCRTLAERPNSFALPYDRLNDAETHTALLEFLGSEAGSETLASNRKKQFTLPVSEGFENWGELEAYIASNPVFDPLPVDRMARAS